jgi:PAS domain S-box-containing protein
MTEIVEEKNYKESTETQMTWTIEKSGKVLALNKMFKSYVGVTTQAQADAADVFHISVVHPDDYQASKEAFAKANRDMKPFGLKRRLKSAKGTYRWFHTKGTAFV